MSTSPALSSSPPRPARSPGAATPSATSVSTPRHTHYHHHHHHHHLPVGHTTHSPATSASGDIIQGKPSEAGGLHTSTSRGNILVPPGVVNVGSLSPVSSTAASTPADLLSVSSRSPSAASRPASPSAPSSPSILASAAANASPLQARSSSSRPTSPARSPIHPRSPTIKHQQQQQQPDFETMSNSTTPSMDSSAVFERDVEFATEHLLTGSEAIDLAAAPVLSEVALAVTSNTPDNNNIVNTTSNLIAASPSPSPLSASNPNNNTTASILGGTSTHSPFAQSLDSTVLSSSPKLPSNAVLFNNDAAIGADDRQAIQPLSERLRRSSGAAAAAATAAAIAPASQANANVRPISDEFSPPPSLSLSPSATASPISSAPGSPIHHIGASSGQFGHAVVGVDSSTGGIAAGGPAGLDVNDGSMSGFSSPPGSAMSGVSISGNKDSKRRLSMISYADIINSERLSDTHSGFSSPTPSSAMSLSTAALPVQGGQSGSNAGLSPAASGMLGSALYSPVTSPEGSLSPALAPPSAKDSTKELEPSREGDGTFSKPANNRTDTMSTTATEVFYMPGQLPLQTPPNITDKQGEDKDVTPTSSSIKKTSDTDDGERKGDELKKSTSSSSWNMVEMGKALVGSAAGAVGSVLGTSGIGSDSPDPAEIKKDN